MNVNQMDQPGAGLPTEAAPGVTGRSGKSRPFPWRLFWIVWGLAAWGIVAVIPYSLTLQSSALTDADLPLPLWQILLINNGILLVAVGLAIAAGLAMGPRTGLGLPWLQRRLESGEWGAGFGRMLGMAAAWGALAGAAIIGLDRLFRPYLLAAAGPSVDLAAAQPPVWQGFLASFYGGVTEEVLMRLFLMTLFVWLGMWVWPGASVQPRPGLLWTANVLAALIFGLGHLPALAGMGIALTPMMLGRTLLLNGVAGLVAGALYWRRGFEAAVVAHFTADLVLHVLAPLLAAL